MAFGTFLFIMFLGGIVFWYFRKKSPESQIEWLEERAYLLYGTSLKKYNSPILYDIHEDDEKRLKETEDKYVRLKERYKYEPKILYKLALDWRDYNLNMFGKVSEWQKLGVNLEENAYNKYDEEIKEHQPIIEEIEKRFDNLLRDK